jgi:DNA-binding NarL/FixJ family response regulator
MKVILVGSADERARMRASLDESVEIVGEHPTLRAAATPRTNHRDGLLLSSMSAVRALMSRDRQRAVAPHAVDESVEDDGALFEALTPREVEVLELLAEGLPNREIARRLGISDQTVKFHVASISGKLGAANRTDAVRRAVRRGLVTL